MVIPKYAEGTFADLLEERINALEEFIYAVFERDEYEAEVAYIDGARDYYVAMCDQLNANAADLNATNGSGNDGA